MTPLPKDMGFVGLGGLTHCAPERHKHKNISLTHSDISFSAGISDAMQL